MYVIYASGFCWIRNFSSFLRKTMEVTMVKTWKEIYEEYTDLKRDVIAKIEDSRCHVFGSLGLNIPTDIYENYKIAEEIKGYSAKEPWYICQVRSVYREASERLKACVVFFPMKDYMDSYEEPSNGELIETYVDHLPDNVEAMVWCTLFNLVHNI